MEHKGSVLTPAQIEVCSLFHQGLSLVEIADLTDRSEKTVRELRYQAKARVLAAGLTWPKRPTVRRGRTTYAASELVYAD